MCDVASKMFNELLQCTCTFQIQGHNISKLDPLGINNPDLNDEIPPELIVTNYQMGKALSLSL